MGDIRYVILSDLHFGAENSMLTSLNECPATAADSGFSADPQRPSPMLSGLIDGLRQLTSDQHTPPTLILAGDVLDLALSPDQVAATVFRGFAQLAFDSGQPAFDPTVHYVPATTTTTCGRRRVRTSTWTTYPPSRPKPSWRLPGTQPS